MVSMIFHWARKEDIKFLVVDFNTFRQRQRTFHGCLESDGVGMRIVRVPPGMRILAKSNAMPIHLVVFQMVRQRSVTSKASSKVTDRQAEQAKPSRLPHRALPTRRPSMPE